MKKNEILKEVEAGKLQKILNYLKEHHINVIYSKTTAGRLKVVEE